MMRVPAQILRAHQNDEAGRMQADRLRLKHQPEGLEGGTAMRDHIRENQAVTQEDMQTALKKGVGMMG